MSDTHDGNGIGQNGWPSELWAIIEEFQEIEDPMEKFELLFEYAELLEPMPLDEQTDETRVKGCQSEAHVRVDLDEEGRFRLIGDGDSQVVKGFIAITVKGLSGLVPSEVLQVPPDFVKEMGLNQTLSPSRANGFLNMFEKVRLLASEQL